MLILAAVVFAVPGLVGLALYGFLRQSIIAKYDRCVAMLANEQRQPRGLARIVDELKQLERFGGVTWNLNAQYVADAINILVPGSADESWHRQCGLPVAPADCLAAAHEKFIICNAAMGRQLANPLLASGIAREEIELARRFLALAFLGHELGHVEEGPGTRVQHLFPTARANGLKCTRLDEHSPSEEQRADEFGVSLACMAIQSTVKDLNRSDARAAVYTLSHLRETLDDDYFAFDDTCGGDDTYPSMSRRKSSFALAYAKCLFPREDLPYASLADDQDAAIRRLEEWLRRRQVTGVVGSALYGADALYRFEVAGTEAGSLFVAFDSSGTRSQVTTTIVGHDKVEHSVLAAWEHAGDVIDHTSDSSFTAEFLAAFSAPENTTDIRRITVTCTPAPLQCVAEQAEKHLPAGVEVRRTSTHAVIEIAGTKVQTFASAADYMAGKTAMTAESEIPLGDATAFIDGDATRLIIAERPGEGDTPSGLLRLGLLTGSGLRWTVLTTLPESLTPLAALGAYGERLVFVLRPSLLNIGGTTQLWTCPMDALNGPPRQTDQAMCDVYHAPADASISIGLANNDLSSLGTHLLRPSHCFGVIAVRQAGWLWLVDPDRKEQDLLPGTGVVNCAADRSLAWVYRMRRLDALRLAFTAAAPKRQRIGLIRKPDIGKG